MANWKDIQYKRQITRKTKLALVLLGFILGLLLLAQAVKVTQVLFSPWKLPSSRSSFWDGTFNLNVLVRSKGISFVSFNPKEEVVKIINIPDITFINVVAGFGKWQVSSIYDLGEGQKGFGGEVLLKKSLSVFFGLPVDGFLDLSDKYSQMPTVDLIDEIRRNPFALFNILPTLKTDLTPFELIRLKLALSGVRFDKITEVNLENTGVLEKFKLPDGTLVYTTEDQRLDSILSDMADSQVKSEHKTIAIFNATDHPQLAQKAARLVTNIGGDVIIVSNGQSKLKTSQVIGEKSKTLERLQQIFETDGKIDPNLKDLVSSRAQINLFLGEDFFNKL